MRIAILFNDDRGLLHGQAVDRFAVEAVVGTAAAVVAACRASGHDAHAYAVHADPRQVLETLAQSRAELVFNLVEAVDGESKLEAALAALLELSKVPYTGSPPETLALALNKPRTKACLIAHGVPVPLGARLARGDESVPPGMPFPWIVKPAEQDASHGISAASVVHDENAARAQAQAVIAQYRQPALVEEFIAGREFNVSILGEGETAAVLPLGEIDFSAFPAGRPALVTYQAKWVENSPDYHGTPSIAARQMEADLEARIREVSLAAYRAIGLRDYGRVDLRIDPRKGPLVLEVNPNPDISPDAGLPRAAARQGIAYAELIGRIIESARRRSAAAD